MSTPRSQLVDEAVTPWYHCISRCVRRAQLCGGDHTHRKVWIVNRLRELVRPGGRTTVVDLVPTP
jgi:hypothetical protein